MTQKAAAAAPKPAASKPAAPRSGVSNPAASKSAAAASKPAASRRRDIDPMAWLTADDAAFADRARWFALAKARATRERLLRNGLAGEFAARLLAATSGGLARQVESWKL